MKGDLDGWGGFREVEQPAVEDHHLMTNQINRKSQRTQEEKHVRS